MKRIIAVFILYTVSILFTLTNSHATESSIADVTQGYIFGAEPIFSIKSTDAAQNFEATPASYTRTVDTTAPNAPTVSGTTPTNNLRPTWTWTSGGNGGNGTFRYKLDSSDFSSGYTEMTAVIYTPATNLPEGSYTLYVQECDAAGNWSNSGSKAIVIDITAPTTAASASVIQLPKTGQTTCYDASGAVISCTGTGQDGDILAGVAWPNPRFTDKGDQTVLDNLTGLMWAKDGNVMETRDPSFDTDSTAGDGGVTWQHALDYIIKLNQENYLGYNDWRMPNITELESMVHAGQLSPANFLISQGFTNVQADYYWSSTYAYYTNEAWIVWMYDGGVSYDVKSSYFCYMWPVRSGPSGSLGSSIISLPRTGQKACYDSSGSSIACAGTGQDGELQAGAAWPGTRFASNGDQTATYDFTGLIWPNDGKTPGPAACGPGGTKTWQGALDYVKCLNTSNYLGYNDWRLPNRKELRSMVHAGQSSPANWLISQGFTNVQAGYYWSSSTYAGSINAVSTDYAWIVNMYDGSVTINNKSLYNYVWPVRSGQAGSLGNLGISINSGAADTNSTFVTIDLPATDTNGVAGMMLSNDRTFAVSSEEAYARSRAWTLPAGDGTKTVYVKFKDSAGNWSKVYSGSIKLDTTGTTATANPAPGTYPTAQSVTLTCSDASGSGCGNIYYTTNGTDPSTSSAVYGSAISIPSTTTLKFFAVDALGNAGSIQIATYTIIPGVSLIGGSIKVVKGEARQTNVLLTWIGGFSSAMDITYAWIGNTPADAVVAITPLSLTPTAGGASATVSLSANALTAAGIYTLRITVTGGGFSANTDIPVTVGSTFALVNDATMSGTKGQTLSPLTTTGGIGTPTFSYTGTLPTGVALNTDGTFSGMPSTRGIYAFTIQVSDIDNHMLKRDYTLRVYDPAYRQLVLEAQSWTVEKGAVSGAIIAKVIDDYGANASVTSNTLIDISSSSSTGRFSVDYGMNFSSANIFSPMIYQGYNTIEFQYKDIAAGTFTIQATGKTAMPSQGWALGSRDILVSDPTPGNLSASRAGTGTGLVVSNPTGINCGSDCQEAYPSGTVVTLNATADPGSAFTGWSGACSGVTCTLTMDTSEKVTAMFRDATAPSVSAGGDGTKNFAFTQTATAIDSNQMTYAWSKVSGPGSITFGSINALSTTISASVDGTYVIRFTATDRDDNSSYSDMALIWDTAVPDTVITAQPANPTNATSATFSFTSEGGSAFQCRLDNGGYENCTSPKGYTTLTEGSHAFSVKANDRAGNVDQTPASYTWTVDVTAPNAPVVGGITPISNKKPLWTWASGGNGGSGLFRYRLDNSVLTSETTETTSPSYAPATDLDEGAHTLYLQERDAAGNWSNPGSAVILIDTIAPTTIGGGISINAGAVATKTTAVTLSLSALDINGVVQMIVSDDAAFIGAASETYAVTKSWTLPSTDGVKTVYVKFGDAAGNWSGSYSDTIILDATGPTMTANPPAGTYFTAQSVSLSCNDASGSGCGTVYYTTDGNDPSTSSMNYNNTPISITSTKILKYFAVDALGTPGPIQTAVYVIQDVAITSGNIKVVKGETRQTTITLTSIGGFNSAMKLSYTYLGVTPVNAVVKIGPSNVTPKPAGDSAILAFTSDPLTAPGSYVIRITATGGEIIRIVDIPVTVAPPAAINNATLSNGEKGKPYASAMTVSGGIAPYTFAKIAGALPDGLTLNADGAFSGNPTTRGIYTFTLQAADSDGHTLTKEYSVRVYDPAYRTFLFEAPGWSIEKSTTNTVFSDWIKVRVVDDYGNPANISTRTPITVTSSSDTGRIRNDGYELSTSNSFPLWVEAGRNFTEFQYKDTTAGSLNISASGVADYDSAAWQAVSHAMTVTSPNLRNAGLTVSATQTSVYGQGVTVNGELRDVQSSPSVTLAGKTVSLIFTSPAGGTTQAYYAVTDIDGKYSYQAGAAIIDAAGLWTVNATFKDGEIYNDAPASTDFQIARADTRLTIFANAKSTAPTGHLTVSGQLYSYTAVPVKLSGIPLCIDFIEPSGSTIHSFTTNTTDDLGRFSFTTTDSFANLGRWKVKVRLAETGSLNVSVSETQEFTVANAAGYAIIIQGDYGGTYRNNYTASLDDIYKKLLSRSFPANNIRYLGYGNTAQDAGIPTPVEATKQNIQDAIENWAAGRILDQQGGIAPLYIIMMDHGSRGLFHIQPDTISPVELDAWVTTLETKIQNSLHQPLNTIIVNGSCYSGSFIPQLSKEGRVIITSGMEDEETSQGPASDKKTYGEYFVYYFFNNLYNGSNMRDAFRDAADLTHKLRDCTGEKCGKNSLSIGDNSMQHPLLDDNGDGKGSWMQVIGQGQGDGTLTSRLVLGLDINPISLSITEVTPTQTVMQGAPSFPAYAKTSDPATTVASWVEVKRPDYVSQDTGTGTGQIVMDLPKIPATLYNSATQQWEYAVTPLDKTGRYTIYYYAMDSNGAVIPPGMGTLYVNTAANKPPLSFNLTNPVNNKEEDNVWVTFQWDKAIDPDNDPLSYHLKIYDDETDSLIKTYNLLSREFYYMNAANEKRVDGTSLFISGKYYKWQVEAVDNKGLATASAFGRFKKTFTDVFNGFIIGRITPVISEAVINTTGNGSAISLPNGYFFMPHIAGDFTMTVSAPGYQSYSQGIKVAELSMATAEITLTSDAPVNLTATISGSGKGTVTAAPAGSNCGSDCTSFIKGTAVTLTAVPDGGSSFTGWSGVCSGSGNTCNLTMSGDKSVTATFRDETLPSGSLSYSGNSYAQDGTVTLNISASDPTGVPVMRFSSDGQNWGSEESYGATGLWNLTGSDGVKTIYVQFKDGVGNWSVAYAKSITLDTAAPVTTASPAGGSYVSSQSVTLTSNEGVTVYYTVDGSTPTESSTPYSSAIAISGPAPVTLKFFAKDSAGNLEQVKTQTYSFDITGPTGTIAINGGALRTNNDIVALTLSATDPAGATQMQFSNDNNVWSTPEDYGTRKSITLPPPDGPKTVYVKFKDGLGNWSMPHSATIMLDTTPPITTASPAGGTYAARQSVTLTADEAATIYYTANGSTPTESSTVYSAPIDIPITATKILKYFAKDLTGNIEPVRMQTYGFDTAGPAGAVVINSGTGLTNNAIVSLTLSAADPSGVSQMQFSNDNSSWSTPETFGTNKSLTLSSPDGPKTVYAKFRDGLGTWSAPYTAVIILDTTAPVTTASPGGGSYALSQTVTLTADAGATIYYTTDGTIPTESLTVYSSPIAIPNTATGILKFFAKDISGNLEQVQVQTYSFDSSGPKGAISINGGAPLTNKAIVALTLSADDPNGVNQMRFSTDNSVWLEPENYSTGKSLTLPAPDGAKTVYVKFKDGLGTWSAPFTASIILDTTAPMTVATPAEGIYAVAQSVTLTVNEGATIYYTADGSNPTETSTVYTSPIAIPNNATRTLKFFAKDSAGNLEEVKSQAYSFDIAGPTGTIAINGGALRTNNAIVALTLAATDPAGVTQMQFSNDNSVWSPLETYGTGKSLTLPSPDGLKTVYAKFRDGLGTWSAPYSASIILDTAAPVTSAHLVGGVYGSAKNVTLSTNEPATIYYTVNDTDPTASSSVYDGAIAIPATMTLKYFAKDMAGNSEPIKAQAYVIDMSGPTVNLSISGEAVLTKDGSITMDISASAGSGILQMQFSDDGEHWSTAETYGTTKTWPLPSGDGLKTVYVRFKNGVGVWSGAYTVTIILDSTAPATTANPAGGTYGAPQTVTLTTNEAATIYYTVNGSEPTESSDVYSKPIAIGAATLKYFARDMVGNNEAVKSQTYTIAPRGVAGDLDGSGIVDITDAIIGLQVTIRRQPVSPLHLENDVNGNWRIGMDDIIYILQKAAGSR